LEKDKIALLKARMTGLSKRLFPQSDHLNIEENKPATFYVLCPEQGEYSSRGVWVYACGVHFIRKAEKQIVCSEIEEAGPCFICEKIREMKARGSKENDIFQFLGSVKYAMNVLVRGEEKPRVFLAPGKVGEEIIRTWKAALDEENLNIFDPLASTAWTVIRSKDGGKTRYEVDFEEIPAPIVTGDDVETRIARILKSAANLDQRFRLPTQKEQMSAWSNR
jgi:hypothetical protein